MSTAYNLPDYCARFFEYKDLDKIHGQPTIDTIAKMLKQLKRNAQRVITTLGGGQLGFLALVISPTAYNAIPNSAFFSRPVDPGTFTPVGVAPQLTRAAALAQLTATDIATQKIVHDEMRRQYNECQAVEAALRNQIIDAVESDYLQPLRNPTTDMINNTIPEIINFLRNTYGQLSPSQLKERERAIDDMIYDPSQPIDSVFNKIQDFHDLCTLIQNQSTDTQLVTYAYLVFQKTGIFMTSLKEWNAKPDADKTFVNFKVFMRQQYLDLQAVGGLMIQHSSLNIVQELKDNQEKLSNSLKVEFQNGIRETMHAFNLSNQENINPNLGFIPPTYLSPNNQFHGYNQPSPQIMEEFSTQTPSQHNMFGANQTSDNPVMTQLMQQMQVMQQQISGLTLTNNQINQFGTKIPLTNQSGQNNDTNPKTGLPWKRYCWSCGCCPHWGKNCPNKKRGHKDVASFKNKMSGSSKDCL